MGDFPTLVQTQYVFLSYTAAHQLLTKGCLGAKVEKVEPDPRFIADFDPTATTFPPKRPSSPTQLMALYRTRSILSLDWRSRPAPKAPSQNPTKPSSEESNPTRTQEESAPWWSLRILSWWTNNKSRDVTHRRQLPWEEAKVGIRANYRATEVRTLDDHQTAMAHMQDDDDTTVVQPLDDDETADWPVDEKGYL